jgi:TPR repeat protein
MYEIGRGERQDRDAAIAWYRKAALLGEETAKANMKILGLTW